MTNKQINDAIALSTGLVECDFCFDLNAMHEAEMTLTKEQGEAWAGLLCDMTDKFDGDAWKHAAYSLAHATAAQRAEAFLRAKGLWV